MVSRIRDDLKNITEILTYNLFYLVATWFDFENNEVLLIETDDGGRCEGYDAGLKSKDSKL